MCTYATVHLAVDGSAKGPNGDWLRVTNGTVYFDHPVHAMAEHTLNIDLTDPAKGPSARIAMELTADTARQLVAAIQAALASAPAELTA
jgi:Family of unknown function (DUF6295)